MAWWYYSAYLAVVLASALLIARIAKVKLSVRRFARAILPVFIIFVLWDVLAVYLGHWSFGLQHTLGIVVSNQPIEEVAFFVVVPFFYIVIWEVCKKRMK